LLLTLVAKIGLSVNRPTTTIAMSVFFAGALAFRHFGCSVSGFVVTLMPNEATRYMAQESSSSPHQQQRLTVKHKGSRVLLHALRFRVALLCSAYSNRNASMGSSRDAFRAG
jgi:hypothetical protein